MDIINLNDDIRNILKESINKGCLKGFTINQSIDRLRDTLYDLETSNQQLEKNNRENIIMCIYVDTLYMLIYKHKMSMMTLEDVDQLKRLCELSGKDDVLAEVSCDPDLFSKLILHSYEFSNLTTLGKTMVIKSLTSMEHRWLMDKNVMHVMDLSTYGRKVELNDLVLDIQNQIKEQDKLLDIYFIDGILLNVSGFISNLIRFDQSSGIDLVLNIGTLDYAVSKYLEQKGYADDNIIDHIDYYENYSLDDIIDRLIYDMSFLQCALSMVISFYIHKSYDDLELSEDLLNNNAVKKLKKKFNQ